MDPKQDPKYDIIDGRIVNRHTGEAIPDDEPIFIFRARDKRAVPALLEYADLCRDPGHVAAIQKRVKHFRAFASRHPERMKLPDTPAKLQSAKGFEAATLQAPSLEASRQQPEEWSFDALVTWATYELIQAITGGKALRSAVHNILAVTAQWSTRQKDVRK